MSGFMLFAMIVSKLDTVMHARLVAPEFPGAKPEAGTRAGSNDKRILETEFREESLAIAQKIKAHAAKKGMSPGHLAFNWVLANPIVTSVIAGPRTLEQWNDYLAALGKKYEADDEELFDSLVRPGHPSTPGYNDPAYPLRGRPARAR
jgi:aryl-alcohol dehydrogenase-like predicted oxidoreductase